MREGRPRLIDAVMQDPKKMDSLFHKGIGMMNPDFDTTMKATIQWECTSTVFTNENPAAGWLFSPRPVPCRVAVMGEGS
jgi:hypothetical protein